MEQRLRENAIRTTRDIPSKAYCLLSEVLHLELFYGPFLNDDYRGRHVQDPRRDESLHQDLEGKSTPALGRVLISRSPHPLESPPLISLTAIHPIKPPPYLHPRLLRPRKRLLQPLPHPLKSPLQHHDPWLRPTRLGSQRPCNLQSCPRPNRRHCPCPIRHPRLHHPRLPTNPNNVHHF